MHFKIITDEKKKYMYLKDMYFKTWQLYVKHVEK